MASAYPVYRSPDGSTEQTASTPAREVQLKHAGWTKVTQPRKKATPTTDVRQPKSSSR
ncbi:hypothetical protein ACGFNU_21285 [Spirillospora sp. NPDC048911]|uniref:hypothetical protein n=1 Tax=Spirillospora sp. NPDC048911 TaxID=3364527 RepID=UPI0037140E3A